MRKRISKRTKPERSITSVKRIIVIAIIFIMLTGMMGVMASNERLISVKIVLSSGYEMNVMTTSTKVSDILKENHIVVLDNETVSPDIDIKLDENKTITITKGENKVKAKESYFSAEEILESYTSIVEKIVTVQEEIPYETVTKDVSNGSDKTQDKVVQAGSNGLKEVTYRIKYKNGNEIEKTEISSKVIKEPVEKIVEVRTRAVTSRSGLHSSSSDLEVIWAIVRQEGGSSYESALAVVSSAVNRINSPRWSRNGSTIYDQLTAKGQYCYSIDTHWVKYLGGNVPECVKQAVSDAMEGKTNHPYTSFRSYSASTSAQRNSGINIGGNVYFGN